MNRRTAIAASAIAAASLLLGGCSATSFGANHTTGVQVLASFYPLQYVTQQVGGHLVQVTSLTPPGAEPHDIELSPREVRAVSDADLVVYLSGFQSAVDAAITARKPAHVVDAADVADLIPAQGTGVKNGTLDPHFWLDPQRLARLAAPVAAALSTADPRHASTYAANAATLEANLGALDTQYRTGLTGCDRHVIVTSHSAFGYLAKRYGLTQIGISGLDPDADPSPARLREIRAVVAADDVTTIFTERLISAKVAQTLASDLGVKVAVLDPVESLADPRSDYRGVMQTNLVRLRDALGCA